MFRVNSIGFLRSFLVCLCVFHSASVYSDDLKSPPETVDDLIGTGLFDEVQEIEDAPSTAKENKLWGRGKNKIPLNDVDLVGLPALQQPPKMNWCWASTAQMAITYKLKKKVSLCGIVSKVLNLDCCNLNNLDVCNQRGNPITAAAVHGLHGESVSANLVQINQDMQRGRVPVIRLHNVADDTYHVAIVKAIQDKGEKILIYDPYEGTFKISRNRMDSGDIYGNFEWVSTYMLW